MKCTVRKKVKGGYLVAILAYLPASESRVRRITAKQFDDGDIVDVLIKSVNGEHIILSHKDYIDRSAEEFINSVQAGDILDGEIRNIQPYGFFVGLGPIDGLAHKLDGNPDPSNSRYEHGDAVRVKVISVNAEERKIGLKLLHKINTAITTLDYSVESLFE